LKSKYHIFELSAVGFLSENEAEQWVTDNLKEVQTYTDDESPWSINETVKMLPNGIYMASIKASK
jgi:hypothetical protein